MVRNLQAHRNPEGQSLLFLRVGPEINDFGVRMLPCLPKAHGKGWGVNPPTLSWGGRRPFGSPKVDDFRPDF